MADGGLSIGAGYESDIRRDAIAVAIADADARRRESLAFAKAVTDSESDANQQTLAGKQTVARYPTGDQTIAGSSSASANHEDAIAAGDFEGG